MLPGQKSATKTTEREFEGEARNRENRRAMQSRRELAREVGVSFRKRGAAVHGALDGGGENRVDDGGAKIIDVNPGHPLPA